MHSSVGARHIISVRCRQPRHADRSRWYCVRHPRRRLRLASILRYRADPADRRWIGEVSRVPVRVWRTQRSVLGPILFGMYVSPIGDVISRHNVQYHQYADDMQLYVSLNPTDFGTLSDIESCASDVSRWCIENALLLNPTKTEAVVFLVQASGCLKSTSHRACGSQELTCSSLTPSSCLE